MSGIEGALIGIAIVGGLILSFKYGDDLLQGGATLLGGCIIVGFFLGLIGGAVTGVILVVVGIMNNDGAEAIIGVVVAGICVLILRSLGPPWDPN